MAGPIPTMVIRTVTYAVSQSIMNAILNEPLRDFRKNNKKWPNSPSRRNPYLIDYSTNGDIQNRLDYYQKRLSENELRYARKIKRDSIRLSR